jgi:hypothetical protein
MISLGDQGQQVDKIQSLFVRRNGEWELWLQGMPLETWDSERLLGNRCTRWHSRCNSWSLGLGGLVSTTTMPLKARTNHQSVPRRTLDPVHP